MSQIIQSYQTQPLPPPSQPIDVEMSDTTTSTNSNPTTSMSSINTTVVPLLAPMDLSRYTSSTGSTYSTPLQSLVSLPPTLSHDRYHQPSSTPPDRSPYQSHGYHHHSYPHHSLKLQTHFESSESINDNEHDQQFGDRPTSAPAHQTTFINKYGPGCYPSLAAAQGHGQGHGRMTKSWQGSRQSSADSYDYNSSINSYSHLPPYPHQHQHQQPPQHMLMNPVGPLISEKNMFGVSLGNDGYARMGFGYGYSQPQLHPNGVYDHWVHEQGGIYGSVESKLEEQKQKGRKHVW